MPSPPVTKESRLTVNEPLPLNVYLLSLGTVTMPSYQAYQRQQLQCCAEYVLCDSEKAVSASKPAYCLRKNFVTNPLCTRAWQS